jgi:hypothetical protein
VSYQRSRKQKVGAKARRIEDRELARIERVRRARRARVRSITLRGIAVVAVLAVLAGIGLAVRAVVAANRRGPANMASDGLLVSSSDGLHVTASTSAPLPDNGTPTPSADLKSSGVTQVVAYVDYSDPASAAFWATDGASISQMVTASQGALTLEIHPVAVPSARESFTPTPVTPSPSASATPSATPTPSTSTIPSPSATPTPTPTPNLQDAGYDYALRAANAFACVANGAPDQALAVNDALFAAQATFGSAGLTDDQLVALVQKAGVTAKGTDTCIRSHHYERWVTQATARAATAVPFDGVKPLGTAPLVVVGGHQYTGKVDDSAAFTTLFLQAYQEASQAASAASGSTPTPTPSDTAGAVPSTEPTGSPTPTPTSGS